MVIALEEARITPDPHNARLHSPRNIGVIEESMQTDGAGRSILVDHDGVRANVRCLVRSGDRCIVTRPFINGTLPIFSADP